MLVPKTDQFPETVDESQRLLDAERWMLVLFNVSDRYGGVMARHGFRASKKNPTTFWRSFLSTERAEAEPVVKLLRELKLRGKWLRSNQLYRERLRLYHAPRYRNMTDFSKPNSESGWRRKPRRRR